MDNSACLDCISKKEKFNLYWVPLPNKNNFMLNPILYATLGQEKCMKTSLKILICNNSVYILMKQVI